MKITLFSRARVSHKPTDLRRIFSSIESYGFDFCVNVEFAPIVEQLTNITILPHQIYSDTIAIDTNQDNVMVCYGGDGTLLEGVHRLGGAQIAVAGINSGHLGFLTSATSDDIELLFESINKGSLRVERRSMLSIEGDFCPSGERLYAVNEFSVQRHGATMISVETFVNSQMVATYHGDGVIISTPTGSTAYSLSAGGPVVSPDCACFVISPLAPHNLTMRPVVVPDSSVITMNISSRMGVAAISLDNRTYPIEQRTTVKIQRSDIEFFLALPNNISFYDALRNKLMWGVDLRN